jgi:hypothetical protein
MPAASSLTSFGQSGSSPSLLSPRALSANLTSTSATSSASPSSSLSPSSALASHVLRLPRGGFIVKTSGGSIQIGIPPETVKDAMIMGVTVPSYFVVPRELFSRSQGINVAEFEFPAYFNFFVLRRRVTLICQADQEALIRTVLQETLFGPQAHHLTQFDEVSQSSSFFCI